MGQVADFLRTLYGGDGQFPGRVALCRFEKNGAVRKRTEWVTPDTLDLADTLADECRKGDGADLYYGVCPVSDSVVLGRGLASDVVGCPGVWADIDFISGAAAKQSRRKYPAKEHVEQLLQRLELKPSLVVDTGGGWHVYWLFHEVMLIETDEQRAEAARLVAGWQRYLAKELDRMGGFEMDPTQDLARILRPAGTWSCRWGRNTSIVEAYCAEGWRHYADDIDQMIPSELLGGTASAPIRCEVTGEFFVDSNAEPSARLLTTILENDLDFRALWKHERKLTSSSEQEFAIANALALAGWPPQQIVNAVIMHRRIHEPARMDKVCRPDYLRTTVGKALTAAAQRLSRNVSPEELQLRDAASAPDAPPEVRDMARVDALDKLSAQLGITVLGFAQYGRRRGTARYYLTVADESADGGEREIEIGPVSAITRGPGAVVDSLYAEMRHLTPAISKKDWEIVKDRLLLVRDLTETADDDEQAAAIDMIRDVLGKGKVVADTPSGHGARAKFVRKGEAFIDGGVAYVTAAELLRYARTRGVDRWDRATLIRTLNRMGWGQRTLHWRQDGGHSSRSYYAIPMTRLVELGAAVATDELAEHAEHENRAP